VVSLAAVPALRWALLVLVTPTIVFPFLWALLVVAVLRFAARLESPAALLLRAGPGDLEITPEGLVVEVLGKAMSAVPRAEVIEGWIEPLDNVNCLVLRLRSGRRLLVEGGDFARGASWLTRTSRAWSRRRMECASPPAVSRSISR
jgi:hypothetical protein